MTKKCKFTDVKLKRGNKLKRSMTANKNLQSSQFDYFTSENFFLAPIENSKQRDNSKINVY